MSRFVAKFGDPHASLDELFESLDSAIEKTDWKLCKKSNAIVVSSGMSTFYEQPSSVEGFHVETLVEGVPIDGAISYFRDACHFADTANAMTTKSEVLWQVDDRAIVRTGFELPWPLQNREFLHGVAVRRSKNTAWVVYTTLSGEEEATLPPPWKGYQRCTMYPSGQRITQLEKNPMLEHCMTYPLGGSISSTIQNTLFHRGHVGAYYKEWKAMKIALLSEVSHGSLEK